MSLGFAVATYFIIWWTVLFAILPIGVRTQGEEGSVVPGTPESAPVRPRFLLIISLTTLVSAGLFALIYAVLVWHIVDFGKLPIGPR
jgi:predicted secreted protein